MTLLTRDAREILIKDVEQGNIEIPLGDSSANGTDDSSAGMGKNCTNGTNDSHGANGTRRHGIDLSWKDIKCFVAENQEQGRVAKWLGLPERHGKPTKQIVNGASGFARAGEILAVMGPSGSGKTTLFNVIAQRPTLGETGYWEGELLLNGQEPWDDWERDMAYVMQKDIFYEELKVYENLYYTALLRLPTDWTDREKLAHLDQTIEELGLEDVKNTKLGTATDRGLSGGEMKRTGIANERLAMPRLILLDEPLTGLDSSRAVDVMKNLKKMANEEGVTVMLTIHQPSSALYECFDSLLMLGKGGRTAYFGPVSNAVPHFSKLGHPLPPLWAPSDHFIELVTDEEIRDAVCDAWCTSPQPEPPMPKPRPPSLAPMPSLTYQIKVLLPRSFKRIRRSYLKSLAWKLHIGLALVFGFVYFGVGKDAKARPQDLGGAIFFLVAHWSWTPLFQGLCNFPSEKDMLTKERASKVYEIRAFYASTVIGEAPLLEVFPVLFFLIFWPMAGLPFVAAIKAFLAISLNIQVCSAMSMFISALCMDQDTGITTAIIVMVFEMCCGGYFVNMALLPAWLSWLRFTSFYFYSFGIITRSVVTESYGEELSDEVRGHFSFSNLGYFWEVTMLVLFALTFRILAYIQLHITKKLKFS